MKRIFPPLLVPCSLLALLFCVKPVSAQDSRFERQFPNSKAEVDNALQGLQGSLKGRLPILEGFVEETSEPLDHFERGFYDCVANVSSDAQGRTLVRFSAKITAWYAGSTAALSGYRVLQSSGRIETDLLDRLEELLSKKTPASVPAAYAVAPRPSPALPSAPTRAALAQPPAEPVTTSTNEDLGSLRLRREEAEKKMKALEGDVQNLEEILRNQAHPDNLAVIRKAGTPILAKPGGAVLLSADAEDEFEVLGMEGSWIHVQISGVSRGWIQRAQLELPEGFAGNSQKEDASGATSAPSFRVTREETHSFTGSWQELHGKTVRIIWVEPSAESSQTSPAEAKRRFAKTAFAEAYKKQSTAAQPPDGVVIVFDSADGGQVSATMSALAQWQSGKLSEDSFWKQCSIDPAELLQNVHSP